VVAGNIGTGKTGLLTTLGSVLSMDNYPERWQDNPWFSGAPRNPFATQLWFLVASGADLGRAAQRSGGVLERSIHENALVFVRAQQVPQAQERLLLALYAELDVLLPDPDLILYLHAPVPALLARVRARARPEEEAVTGEYLERLESLYGDLLDHWDRCPVITIDTEKLDLRTTEGQQRAAALAEKALP